KKRRSAHYSSSSHEVEDFARFESEIDLHIEKILDRPGKMSQSEMLRLQILAFDQYLEQAIRLGVDRVFIIHGVGKGKLKNKIASSLIQNPDVETFKNEYHPKYGYGATEVIFKRSS
ncbi:MAG: Smr/MutS family protein, partial [Bacteroidota bacterium]